MSKPYYKRVIRNLVIVAFTLLCGGCGSAVFLVFAVVGNLAPQSSFEFLAIYSPLPHHVPEHPGGVSLRFAMVHDVIHERFARHGDAYYEQRNLQTLTQLSKLSDDDPARWPLIDDLCVGLERLGETDTAIPLMQDKFKQQQAAGLSGIELYTSLANLGTFLVHANFAAARSGDSEAFNRFKEGVELVRQATEVNPGAHFGRERWQLVIGKFLLEAFQNPNRLRETDFLGNPLEMSYEDIMDSDYTYSTSFGKASRALQGRSAQYQFPDFFPPEVDLDDPEHWNKLKGIRQYITYVGPEETGVPFDEPVLGIIGMWREGGGANPHFSLALAETMLRVGQRYIAWKAYEKTKLLADRYSNDPELQEFLKAHCQNRQSEIETSFETLGETLSPEIHPEYPVENSTPKYAIDPAQLRSQFEEELSLGQKYQREFQQFEAEQIQAGVSLDAPDFYTSFYRTHSSIATTPGREEMIYYVPNKRREKFMATRTRNYAIFGAGLGTFVASLIIYTNINKRQYEETDSLKNSNSATDQPSG